jgi:N-acetyl-anhydromuramyl-L-alanine amidase AmpD
MFSLNRFSLGALSDTVAYALNEKSKEGIAIVNKLNLSEIISVDFPEDQYYKEQTTKKQIILHHTVSGQGTDGDISWWRQTADRIATAIIIGWDGKIYQCLSTIYWAHHLGTTAANNRALNMASIGIEIDAWGALMEVQGKWYPASWDANLKKNIPNITIKPIQNVELYPAGFKGFYGFEKYTDEQIESVRKLLIFWKEKYGIPLTYNPEMWDISEKALRGDAGIWTHVSFRKDKSDCYPDKRLIQMLKSLI